MHTKTRPARRKLSQTKGAKRQRARRRYQRKLRKMWAKMRADYRAEIQRKCALLGIVI